MPAHSHPVRRIGRAARGTAVALICGAAAVNLAACTKTASADSAVASASPAAASSVAAPPSGPAALQQAFAAAMPNGPAENRADGHVLQFEPKKLLTLPGDGTRVVMISEGSDDTVPSCITCGGDLRVTYLDWNGTMFVPADNPKPFDISGEWGHPPTWSLKERRGKQLLRIQNVQRQGDCTEGVAETYVIGARGVAEVGAPKEVGGCDADTGGDGPTADAAQ